MDIVAPGDTFSGKASYESCFNVEDHPAALVIQRSSGNAFSGSIISRIKNSVRSAEVSGFFHIPSRQLIIVPERRDSNALSLVCNYDRNSDNDADCQVVTDFMTRRCGSIGFTRDRTSQSSFPCSFLFSRFLGTNFVPFTARFLKTGDTFSGTVHFDSCAQVEDHPMSLVITSAAGNAYAATVVSKVRGQVRSFKTKGFFYVSSRQLFLVPLNHDSTSAGVICTFSSSDNSADCQLARDSFTRPCGAVTIQRDYTGQ